MSWTGQYESLEQLMQAVSEHVSSLKDVEGLISEFKINVYAGRSCYEFTLKDEVWEAKKEIRRLEKRLEVAKANIEVLERQKRRREDDTKLITTPLTYSPNKNN